MRHSYPDCVRCFGKCFQWRDVYELVQKCLHCKTESRATTSTHTYGGREWTVRTWSRRAM